MNAWIYCLINILLTLDTFINDIYVTNDAMW